MKRILRAVVLVMAGGLVLAACSQLSGDMGGQPQACSDADLLAGQDWDQAEHISMSVRDGEYTPMVLVLAQGRAYVLTIENKDKAAWRFQATGFFRSVAVRDVRIGDGVADETACIGGVSLPGETAVTVRFATLGAGHFRFQDSAITTAFTGDGFGVIRID